MLDQQATESTDNTIETHPDQRILNGLIGITGFGLCRAWIVFCLAAPLSFKASLPTDWIYLLCGALIALVVAFVVKRCGSRVVAIRRYLFIATVCALVVSALLVSLGLAQLLEIVLLFGFIIGGLGAGMLQILWGERFASYKISYATIVSPAAAIVTALFVSLAASQGLFLVGFIAFPLLSYALLLVLAVRGGLSLSSLFKDVRLLNEADRVLAGSDDAASAQEDAQTSIPVDSDKSTGKHREKQELEQAQLSEASDLTDSASSEKVLKKRKPWANNVGKLMFSIMLFSFLCRTFDAVPISQADPLAFVGGGPLMALIVVGAVFLLFAAVLKDHFNPTLTYRLSLPIMVAGFVAIALFFDTHAALSVMLINIGYEFFDILSWILFTEISRREGEQPLRIFGLGVAFMFIGMALGLIVGQVFNALVLSGEVQITVVAMLSILSLVVVAFLVIPEGTIDLLANAINPEKRDGAVSSSSRGASATVENNEASDTEEPVPTEGRLEAYCSAAATDYRLTPRESEVLVLLAYGRTLAIIARDLHIATGTARTHIENIYRKLDVHKQQELIDLIEDYELSRKTDG